MVGSHETPNMCPNLNITLNDQQHFKLNKIICIRDYFLAVIKVKELMSKRLSKHIAPFHYFQYFSVATSSISIALFATHWSTCRNNRHNLLPCVFNVYRN